jgi:tetratricopeptide (TPR) repeat protein
MGQYRKKNCCIIVLLMVLVTLGPACSGRFSSEKIVSAYKKGGPFPTLEISYPFQGTLFPPEIPAPLVIWKKTSPKANSWIVLVEGSGLLPSIGETAGEEQWRPSVSQWEAIKSAAAEAPVTITIIGVNRSQSNRILSAGNVTIGVSIDSVGAPLFYREVILPFENAVKDPSKICWRFGTIALSSRPPVVLTGLPVCGNCHSFSRDGKILGMDVDYANDKGSYALATVQPEIVLDKKKIITWNDYRKKDGEQTFGLLSQVSPDGRYVVSTVKDASIFVPRPDLFFSQLFFPIKGILAVYDRAEKKYFALPGADDKRFVNSNPVWSPSGDTVLFIRSKAIDRQRKGNEVLMLPDECRDFLEGGRTFLYDVYRIPFNKGKGGSATPIRGASGNGMSNFFPRVSPDGKWIVFCQARSFALLQPDSRLFILPSQGGVPRPMTCNTARMNSWHSWSPNGKWLVFSSKANGPYTQLFITHINEKGEDAPPVLLEYFTSPDRAANIPEFVNVQGDAIRTIRERFIDAYSYTRAGVSLETYNDLDNALEAYKLSLDRNPYDAQVNYMAGKACFTLQRFQDADRYFRTAISLQPEFFEAAMYLANLCAQSNKFDEARKFYGKAFRLKPDNGDLAFNRGLFFDMLQQTDSAIICYRKAVSVRPTFAAAHNNLGMDLEQKGRREDALVNYEMALRCDSSLAEAKANVTRLKSVLNRSSLR